MKKYIYIWSLPVLLTVLLFGCHEDTLDTVPLGALSEDSFWKTEGDAQAGLTAIYDAMQSDFRHLGWGNMAIFDLFTQIGRVRNGGFNAIANGTYDPSSGVIRDLWRTNYKGVVRANDFITHIDAIEMDAAIKARLTGEAKFLRAMFYFMLVDNFGDIPLFETVPTVEDALVSRSPKAEVVALMKSDIEFAIANLDASYTGNNVGRATIGAATALKVKIALIDQDWATAATAAEQIMGMGYDLVPNYSYIFSPSNENNEEVIFDIQYIFQNDAETGNQYEKLFAPRGAAASGWSWVQPTLFLVDKFEVIDANPTYVVEDSRIPTEIYDHFEGRDPRMDATIIRPGAHFVETSGDKIHPFQMRNLGNTQTRFWARKYVIEGPTGSSFSRDGPVNWIVFRYADVLLNYLEAVAERDGGAASVSQGVLDATINKIRTRASNLLPLYTAGNITMEDIRDERIRELAYEGWHFSDMKRWETINTNNGFQVLGLNTSNNTVKLSTNPIATRVWESKHRLFPIPQSEIDINPNLKPQNTGW